jgi:hypothetical protein
MGFTTAASLRDIVSLADEAAALTRKAGKPCGVAELDPALRAELEDALAAGLSATSLWRALKNRGIDLSDGVITRHKRHDCSCRG